MLWLAYTIQLNKGQPFEYGDFSLDLRVVQHLLADHVSGSEGHRYHYGCRSKAPFSEAGEEILQGVACIGSFRFSRNFYLDGDTFMLGQDWSALHKQDLHILNLDCFRIHLLGSDFSAFHLRWLQQAPYSLLRVLAKSAPVRLWHDNCCRNKPA